MLCVLLAAGLGALKSERYQSLGCVHLAMEKARPQHSLSDYLLRKRMAQHLSDLYCLS